MTEALAVIGAITLILCGFGLGSLIWSGLAKFIRHVSDTQKARSELRLAQYRVSQLEHQLAKLTGEK